ncbi:MAG TPA: ABC transporter permease [Vicinamibacterales bacterium]|nr:ABC transporter permease [Vicinamibacterales bacterium]
MGTLLQDLRFALRNLRKTPAFPLAAIGTLALGIGATTALFSTVNAVLLRPLPYPNPQDLYGLRTALTDGRVTTGLLAGSEIVRLNDPNLSISRAVGLQQQDVTLLRDDGTPLRTRVYAVSEGFFELFGLPMTLGGFTPEQFAANGPPVVVISHPIWRDFFNADPAIVGKPIRFAEFSTTIAGVAPPAFDTPHAADFWVTRRLDPQDVGHGLEGYMRVKPGTTIERVRSEMAGVMAGLARDFPASALSRVYVVSPLVESIVGDLGPILIVVLSATGLLLLLACVNVTNLLFARGASRAREMAVRVALGAGRGRIVRQLLTESVVLSTAGALLGLLVAYLGVRLLLRIGAAKLPRLESVPFDGYVLLFALAALVVSGLLVGFAPALRLARTDVKTLMNESSRSATGGPGTTRWLNVMTVAEIALAITLVAGAGWLIRGFASLRAIDPGFVAARRVLFDVSMQGPKYRDNQVTISTANDLLVRLRALPGVAAAGGTSSFPLRGNLEASLFVQLRAEAMDPKNPMGSRQRAVTPGFFDAMGSRIIAGRDFNSSDRQGGAVVAIVNRTFARRHLANRDPIGVQFSAGYPTVDPRNEATIIGVVDDIRQKALDTAAEPAFYTAHAQLPFRRLSVVVATTVTDPTTLQSTIREEVRKTDPQMAVEFELVSDLVGATLRRQELGMTLMLIFGVVAVALAAVGIYGVIAYASSQRSGEVATRLALGATPATVFWLMLRQGRTLAIIGTAIGLTVAYLAGRVISSHIYQARASDPMILGGATIIVLGIAAIATTIPAFRASRLDPARVLRPE